MIDKKNIVTKITPKKKYFYFNFKEFWQFRDLLWILVKRDFKTFYRQTILGPLWFFIQPVISTVVFTFIFNKIAKISTNDIPPHLFYLSGIIAWNYFSNCLISTSSTFINNANLFEKVYFPRIIMPTSIIISGLVKFGVQLCMFISFYLYYILFENLNIYPSIYSLLILPLLTLQMGLLGQGLGMLISALTTKYRDLSYLLTFGVQLLMYGTPIVYPLDYVPEKFKLIILINPLTSIIETFRNVLFGDLIFEIEMISYSIFSTILIFFIGLFTFNKIEKTFIDTI